MNDPRTTANDFIHENISDQKTLTTKAKMKCQKMYRPLFAHWETLQ